MAQPFVGQSSQGHLPEEMSTITLLGRPKEHGSQHPLS